MLTNSRDKINQFMDDINVLRRSCKIVEELSPRYLIFNFIKALLDGISPYIPIYMLALIIDELVGNKNKGTLLLYILISVGGSVGTKIITILLSKKINVLNELFVFKIKKQLNNKKLDMDYPAVENPENIEKHSKIIESMFIANGGMNSIASLVYDVTFNCISLIVAITVVLLSSFNSIYTQSGFNGFSLIILLVTILMLIASVFISNRNSTIVRRKFYNLAQNSSTNKYLDYYHFHYMEDDQAGKDIHIFGQKDLIVNEVLNKGRRPWMNVLLGSYSLNQKYISKNILISTFIGGYAYIFVGLRALAGYISLGSVTKTYAAITIFITTLTNLLDALLRIQANNRFVRRYLEFIDLPIAEKSSTLIPEYNKNDLVVEFNNVSFKYPGAKDYAVKDLSFKISSSNRIAIVGTNGSGKTTMIKLLCGLYKPQDGSIILNGRDISEYNQEEYMKLFTIVFQDFKLLSLPIGENLAISTNYDEEKAWNSLKVSGMQNLVQKYPQKLNHYLYKYVDGEGVDLSGGEEQKLAISRAYYKDAPFVILDEPTAALDPESEFDIYTRYDEIIGMKTGVFISHRLSSCKFCDQIYVFDDGRIVQIGSHEELLKDGSSTYSQLWQAQAQYYE